MFYVDVFLIQNFLMDLLALLGVNCFLKRQSATKRLIGVAALASGISCLLLLFCRDRMLFFLLMHFVVNTGMVMLAFPTKGWKLRLENWLVMYLSVILLGGLTEYLQECGGFMAETLWRIIFTGAIGLMVVQYLLHRKNYAGNLYPVRLYKGDRCMELMAYWDSGNQLEDPYTGNGISILSFRKAEDFIEKDKDFIRYVPYRSLGEEHGLLAVTNVDELWVTDGHRKIKIRQAAIGIAEAGLMKEGEYDLILHASIL